MSESSETPKERCKNRIRDCWIYLKNVGIVPVSISNTDGVQYFLDPVSLANAVEQYDSDCSILKIRYAEGDKKIQVPRIAGLMAGAILKNKPITVREGFARDGERKLNEILAIWNGIFLCDQFSETMLKSFISDENFCKWFNDCLYLVQNRNWTSEGLILIFETLCLGYFPEAMHLEDA
ncbi:hypothetical protein AGMMS49938_18060 [Fibrobacterales bacterium]|nr:hypothetical protein AGMMS49938_18060 [Fibrobacterales bacterium]